MKPAELDVIEAAQNLQENLELFPINLDMQDDQYALMIHMQNLVNTYGNELVYEFLKNQIRIYEKQIIKR